MSGNIYRLQSHNVYELSARLSNTAVIQRRVVTLKIVVNAGFQQHGRVKFILHTNCMLTLVFAIQKGTGVLLQIKVVQIRYNMKACYKIK